MQKLIRGASAEIAAQFLDGNELPLTTAFPVTVTVTNDSGAELESGEASPDDAHDAAFVYRLSSETLGSLAVLKARWEDSAGLVTTTYHTVVEARAFTLRQLFEADPLLANAERYSRTRLLSLRDWFEGVLDAAMGAPFLHTYSRVIGHVHTPGHEIHTGAIYPKKVMAISRTVGTSETPMNVDGMTLAATPGGLVISSHHLAHGTYSLGVVSGVYPTPPLDIQEAGIDAVRSRMLESKSPVSARQTSMRTSEGDLLTFASASPDRPTGYPSVDAVIMRYAKLHRVPGVG